MTPMLWASTHLWTPWLGPTASCRRSAKWTLLSVSLGIHLVHVPYLCQLVPSKTCSNILGKFKPRRGIHGRIESRARQRHRLRWQLDERHRCDHWQWFGPPRCRCRSVTKAVPSGRLLNIPWNPKTSPVNRTVDTKKIYNQKKNKKNKT